MEIEAQGLVLRPWRASDQAALVRYANNRNVWLNLDDGFPHPYTAGDADAFIARKASQGGPPRHFAIAVGLEAVGGIGFDPLEGVSRRSARIGYWLGQPFWGRGLATEALRCLGDYAFEHFALERLEAIVFEWNPASCRVLEKAGYALEARLHKSVFKDGQLIDCFLYARLRESPERAA